MTAGTPSEADGSLSRGGELEGAVSAQPGGERLAGVEVCAWTGEGEEGLARCTVTGEDGSYLLPGLAEGLYELEFWGWVEGSGIEYVPVLQSAHLAGGAVSTGHDAMLGPLVPVPMTAPSISGRTAPGETLTVSPGSWTSGAVPVGYQWEECDALGEACTPISGATGTAYNVRSADDNQTIRVRETVSDGFARASATSAQTELVKGTSSESTEEVHLHVPLPASAILALSQQPPPQPAPIASQLGVTSSVPSSVQVRALLARLSLPRGRRGKMGALLRRRGYFLSFDAPSAGHLAISWYVRTGGAHGARSHRGHRARTRRLLIASAHVAITKAGRRRVKVRLTSRGRGMLRHARRHGRHLHVVSRAVFTPTGGAQVRTTRSFTLRR